jgi:hypothetical protein
MLGVLALYVRNIARRHGLVYHFFAIRASFFCGIFATPELLAVLARAANNFGQKISQKSGKNRLTLRLYLL